MITSKKVECEINALFEYRKKGTDFSSRILS